MQTVELYSSKTKCLKRAALGLVLVGAGAFILWVEPNQPGFLAGWSSILFFGACSLFWVWLAVDSGPILVVDDTGIRDRHAGLLLWQDIVSIRPRGEFLCLNLRDETAYLARMSFWCKLLSEANVMLGFSKIILNLAPVDALAASNAYLLMKQRLDLEIQKADPK